MKIVLYKNTSQHNVLHKQLTETGSFNDVTITDYEQDIDNISFLFSTDIDFNYLYIPDFKRYYYIDSVELSENGMKLYRCSCDLLMSFQADILNYGIIRTQGNTKIYAVSDVEIDRTPTNIFITLNRTYSDNSANGV